MPVQPPPRPESTTTEVIIQGSGCNWSAKVLEVAIMIISIIMIYISSFLIYLIDRHRALAVVSHPVETQTSYYATTTGSSMEVRRGETVNTGTMTSTLRVIFTPDGQCQNVYSFVEPIQISTPKSCDCFCNKNENETKNSEKVIP